MILQNNTFMFLSKSHVQKTLETGVITQSPNTSLPPNSFLYEKVHSRITSPYDVLFLPRGAYPVPLPSYWDLQSSRSSLSIWQHIVSLRSHTKKCVTNSPHSLFPYLKIYNLSLFFLFFSLPFYLRIVTKPFSAILFYQKIRQFVSLSFFSSLGAYNFSSLSFILTSRCGTLPHPYLSLLPALCRYQRRGKWREASLNCFW